MTGPKEYKRRAIEACERKAHHLKDQADAYAILASLIDAGDLSDMEMRKLWAIISFQEEL